LILDLLERWDGSKNESGNSNHRKYFFNASEAFGVGDILKQPDLGRTLEILSRDIDSFYVGEIAQQMVDFVIDAGGNWTLSDLAGYKVQEREPVSIDFYGS
jgi:gamma-glutamyltranspeptidase/glutathione hydrolase